jgi:hypothetical protein
MILKGPETGQPIVGAILFVYMHSPETRDLGCYLRVVETFTRKGREELIRGPTLITQAENASLAQFIC